MEFQNIYVLATALFSFLLGVFFDRLYLHITRQLLIPPRKEDRPSA